MTAVVITGFEPFGDHQVNASWGVAQGVTSTLKEWGLASTAVLLPVVFAEVKPRIDELIAAHQPHVLVHLGISAACTELTLEVCAVNARVGVDNSGAEHNEVIDPTAPAVLELPAWVRSAGAHLCVSEDAGRYVCNTTLFHNLKAQLAGHLQTGGFIHIPAVDPSSDEVVSMTEPIAHFAWNLYYGE